ncbi:MAG: amidohydrolase, partial [Oscillospiraceae bacterium]|nr:amidohydrolase [Oscillospiraceae bacterium]
EDFACVLEQVPGVLLYISTGYVDRPVAAAHDPKVIYNEDALCQAAAYIAHAATRWLADNK